MKKNKISQTGQENVKFENKNHRPEIRGNMDSRKNLEQQRKGTDMTHNRKEDLHKGNKK